MSDKKGTVGEEIQVWVVACIALVIMFTFFFYLGIPKAISQQEETIIANTKTDLTIIHLNYLKSPYEQGTIADEYVRITLEKNVDEQTTMIEQLHKKTQAYFSAYPNLELHLILLAPEQPIDIGEVTTENKPEEATLTKHFGTSCIAIPIPEHKDAIVKLVVRNIHESTGIFGDTYDEEGEFYGC